MNKFKEIVIRPLTELAALNLQFVNKESFDLTGHSPEKINEILHFAAQLVAKTPGAIMATSMGGQSFITTNFKASEDKTKQIFFPEPNPICIYYKSANEHLLRSVDIKRELLSTTAIQDSTYKFDVFVNYFQETSEGVTQLSKTIEGFINQIIPDNTEIEINKKKGKKALEWLTIGTKLRELMIELRNIDFHKTNEYDYCNITSMISLRDDLVHLKTDRKENYTAYQSLYKRLVDFDQIACSNSVFTFVNTMSPGYFIEKSNNASEVQDRV